MAAIWSWPGLAFCRSFFASSAVALASADFLGHPLNLLFSQAARARQPASGPELRHWPRRAPGKLPAPFFPASCRRHHPGSLRNRHSWKAPAAVVLGFLRRVSSPESRIGGRIGRLGILVSLCLGDLLRELGRARPTPGRRSAAPLSPAEFVGGLGQGPHAAFASFSAASFCAAATSSLFASAFAPSRRSCSAFARPLLFFASFSAFSYPAALFIASSALKSCRRLRH